ncbi:thermopsin family protease [Acidianus brierleyi]|nr:thermopsin family protease [Acidianus brierleyi]
MKAIFLILIILLPLVYTPFFHSQSTLAYPTGMTFFPFTSSILTNFVEGVINVYNLSIGSSYLPNGAYLTSGNASLQLNSILNGKFWAQNVALFHEINSKEFLVTMVVNFWNLSGPFENYPNTTTYEGLGVYCYQGPSFILKTPFSLILYMNSSNGLEFGYIVNNTLHTYLKLPFPGEFTLGGFTAGLPNDLELVWGGPGGGSTVYINEVASEELFYESSNKLSIVPSAISVGLDTAESAYGISVTSNLDNIFHPFATISKGYNTPSILWPIPPSITVTQVNKTVNVKVSINGKPLVNQEVEVLYPTLTGFKVGYENITNSSGLVTFPNASTALYIIYYPGNFSLATAYSLSSSSAPILQSIASKFISTFQSLTNFLKTYNFKKALSSDFNHIKYKGYSTYNINLVLIEYISAFAIGVLISAILIKYKF